MTGSDDGLEYQCRKCGEFVPSRAKRCPRCGTEVDTEEESVEAILEELTSMLNVDVEDEEERPSIEEAERPPDEGPRQKDSPTTEPDEKVIYKKVKKGPP